MPSPNSPVLRRLDCLNRSLSEFHGQLCNVLYGEEYRQCVPNLQHEDLVWLIDYLDKVCRCTVLPHSALRPHRLSMASILPATHSGSVYTDSVAYAALGGYSQHHTHFHLTFSTLAPTHSPQEVMLMCTREHSMVRVFASNVYGFTPGIHKTLLKCVADTVVPPAHHR
jgi:hypothetical protein